ncbi:MAG: ATP-dependent RecD-like DNA helicase [Desulfobacterales bacterium]
MQNPEVPISSENPGIHPEHQSRQDKEERQAAAEIKRLLNQSVSEGHVCIPEDRARQSLDQRLELGWEAIENALERLVETGEVVVDSTDEKETRLYTASMHRAEYGIAARLAAMISLPPDPPGQTAADLADELENRFAVRFSQEQTDALQSVIHSRVSVITGGPGTGKTTLIRAVAAAFSMTGNRVCLAAPTGRAARRLSEITARQAHTVHKLLGYHLETRTFDKDQDNPVEADVLIIDEASMIDSDLMYHLLCATRLDSRLILVGDVFQLPPVGPGNVLSDIIESGIIPVHHLTEIFRQAARSTIVRNAHHIRSGNRPELVPLDPGAEGMDFFMLEAENTEDAASAVVDLCTRRLPDIYGFVPGKDIQVLTPVHKGEAGTVSLNRRLQEAINPGSEGIQYGSCIFRTGDRVMHLKNDYSRKVFNGDTGNITRIDPVRQMLRVDYYGREVSYETEELVDLTLGYAISVHKSQGSEYPAMILPMITRHYVMLQRNLLYTAITRAKELAVLVGSTKAVDIALKNNNPARRLSGLTQRLRYRGE